MLSGMRLPLALKLPDDVQDLKEPVVQELADSVVERRWIDVGPNGLAGKRIEIVGLQATITDVLVRVERLDGTTQITRLTPSRPSFVVEAAPRVLEVARTYTVLGIEHILTGIDHLLFVLALVIITQGGWKLVKTVTAFTVSHSITLTLATLGYVHIPQRPVEAAIALSIVFVAAEILRGRQGHIGITARAPWVVALLFGLMHGLGFASGLKDAGLPDGHIPTARLFFSIGVEAGHFLFIGCVLALTAVALRAASRLSPINQQRSAILQLVPPYAIGTVAMFWVIQESCYLLMDGIRQAAWLLKFFRPAFFPSLHNSSVQHSVQG
jgi:hydrogenase/urease accessory protein HupE